MGSLFSYVGSSWLRPKESIRGVVGANPSEGLIFLFFLAPQILGVALQFGVYYFLMEFLGSKGLGLDMNDMIGEFMGYYVGMLAVSVVLNLIMLYLYCWLITKMVKFIHHKDTPTKNARIAVAWYNLLATFLMIAFVIPAALGFIAGGVASGVLFFLSGLLAFIGGIWIFIIFFHFIAGAHGLTSAWHGFLVSLISGIITAIIVIILSIPFGYVLDMMGLEDRLEQQMEMSGQRIQQQMMQNVQNMDQGELENLLKDLDVSNLEGLGDLGGLDIGEFDLEGINFEGIDLDGVDLGEINWDEIDQDDIDAFKDFQNQEVEVTPSQ